MSSTVAAAPSASVPSAHSTGSVAGAAPLARRRRDDRPRGAAERVGDDDVQRVARPLVSDRERVGDRLARPKRVPVGGLEKVEVGGGNNEVARCRGVVVGPRIALGRPRQLAEFLTTSALVANAIVPTTLISTCPVATLRVGLVQTSVPPAGGRLQVNPPPPALEGVNCAGSGSVTSRPSRVPGRSSGTAIVYVSPSGSPASGVSGTSGLREDEVGGVRDGHGGRGAAVARHIARRRADPLVTVAVLSWHGPGPDDGGSRSLTVASVSGASVPMAQETVESQVPWVESRPTRR